MNVLKHIYGLLENKAKKFVAYSKTYKKIKLVHAKCTMQNWMLNIIE